LPNIEQHDEKPSEMAAKDTARARFFMIVDKWNGKAQKE
jgi:hypothetical protein